MRKTFILLLILSLALIGCQKKDDNIDIGIQDKQTNITQPSQADLLKLAKEQITNYQDYQFTNNEISKLVKGENGDIYYHGADKKRYVFPNEDVFKSWFKDYNIDKLEVHDLQTLYETALGGNVTLRPGSLLQTETDYNVYIVIDNGQISPIAQSILNQIYDNNWSEKVIHLPNYYFTHYDVGKSILTLNDFPEIPKEITIDEDKNLK